MCSSVMIKSIVYCCEEEWRLEGGVGVVVYIYIISWLNEIEIFFA